MSHYTKMSVLFRVKFEHELLTALRAAYGETSVTVHEKPVELTDYQGRRKSSLTADTKPCHIVVDRAAAARVGSLSNELGFCREKDGSYTPFIDPAGWTKVAGKVTQDYVVGVSKKQMKTQGFEVQQTAGKNGAVKVRCTAWQ